MYYLTFLNIKIKDYYCFVYYFTYYYYYILYVSYYIIYLIIHKERTKNKRNGRERNRAKDDAAIFASSSPLFCLLPSPSTPSPVLPFRLRLRFLLFFALISSARSHLFALPSSCSSFLALLPAYWLPSQRQPLTISPVHTLARLEWFTPSGSGRDTIATTSPPIDQQQGRADLFPPLPPRLVGGDGRADHQPGRATTPRSHRRPSPPCRGASA